jgi:hypothetical protein
MHFLRCHVNGGRACHNKRKYQGVVAPVQKKTQHITPPLTVLFTAAKVVRDKAVAPKVPSSCCVRVAGMKYTHTKRMVRESVRTMAKFQANNAMISMTFHETHVETNSSSTRVEEYIRAIAGTDV